MPGKTRYFQTWPWLLLIRSAKRVPNRLVIRIRVDGKARCPLGVKFGVEPPKALSLIKIAKDLGLNVVGVSFHVGSGCEDAKTYHRAIKAARGLFDYAEQIGYNFDLLDIGGGFPGQKDAPLTFDEVSDHIFELKDWNLKETNDA